MTKTMRLSYEVPYYAQIASPELAEEIFAQGLDPIYDPRWAESGASNPEEYAYWVERACGVACLKMCIEALGGEKRPLVHWARAGLERGGYLIRRDENGVEHEIGWVHSALAEMAREAGFAAEAKSATLRDIIEFVEREILVIASVSYEAGDDRLPITKKGGHLMVVTGAEYDETQPLAIYVHNPSGRKKELQANARLSAERFEAGYTGRVITIEPVKPVFR